MHVIPTTDLESKRFAKNKTTAPAQITQSARLPWDKGLVAKLAVSHGPSASPTSVPLAIVSGHNRQELRSGPLHNLRFGQLGLSEFPSIRPSRRFVRLFHRSRCPKERSGGRYRLSQGVCGW